MSLQDYNSLPIAHRKLQSVRPLNDTISKPNIIGMPKSYHIGSSRNRSYVELHRFGDDSVRWESIQILKPQGFDWDGNMWYDECCGRPDKGNSYDDALSISSLLLTLGYIAGLAIPVLWKMTSPRPSGNLTFAWSSHLLTSIYQIHRRECTGFSYTHYT